jgi:hypothetical protein
MVRNTESLERLVANLEGRGCQVLFYELLYPDGLRALRCNSQVSCARGLPRPKTVAKAGFSRAATTVG